MSEEKVDRNNQIMLMINTKTQVEIAAELGISRQRVAQIIDRNGGLKEYHAKYYNRSLLLALLGTMSDTDVRKETGISLCTIGSWRKRLGIPKYSSVRPPTCEDCSVHPYAKGMCRSCYARAKRKEKK